MKEDVDEFLSKNNFELASVGKRAIAMFIDEFILSSLIIISFWSSFENFSTTEEIIDFTNSIVLEYIFLKIVYQTFFIMQYGASIGKIFTKIKVVEISTIKNPSIVSSLNRSIFRIVSEMVFYIGFALVFSNPFKQTLHDKTAKTVVVNY